MEDQVNKNVDEINRIYGDSDKMKTNHNVIPLTQDTEKREVAESSKLSIECQDLKPTTATENNKEEIPTEKTIANNIPGDENVTKESNEKEHPKEGMTNSQMVVKDEQSETKPTENENSVVSIISLYSTTGSKEKILKDNQVTSFVSESLVKNNSNIETTVETTESAMEQKTRKPDYASGSSDETNENNEVTNSSPFTGISEEQTYQNDYEAPHQIMKDHSLEARKTENMTNEKDHGSTSMKKNGDENVVYDAQITHTEDMIEQNTEEIFHDGGKKLQLLEKVEAKYFHSDQGSLIHEPKEIEIRSTKREKISSEKLASSSVSEHLLTEIDTQDESRNKDEKETTSYTNKLSQKTGDSIGQIDEEEQMKTWHQISSGRHLNEPHTSNRNKDENHECETSRMQEERRQDTKKKSEDSHDIDVGSEMFSTSKNNETTNEEERTPASAAVELSVPASVETSIQPTHERNEALNGQILEDLGQANKIAEESCTLEKSVKLSLGENLDTTGSNYQKQNADQKEMLHGLRNVDSPIEKDNNDLEEISRQIEITYKDVKDDAGSIHAEEVCMKNEELYDEEELEANADCSHGDQESKPDDLPKEENIRNEDFEKLLNEKITNSSITEKVLDETKQDEDRDVALKVGSSDSDKTVEDTDANDEISKEDCLVESQNLVVKNVESQEANIKSLETHESAEKPRNVVKESQSHSLGMGLESIPVVRDHVTNVEGKEEICGPPSVEFSIQQTQKDNQVVTEQISEDHALERKSEEVETTVTALEEFSNKYYDVMASCREEDRKENLSDDREVDLFQQINASQEEKIDSSSKRARRNADDIIGRACTEQSSLITRDETFHDEGKEAQSLEEVHVGSMHVNTHDRVDDYASKAENTFASSVQFLPETVETLSSDVDLLKERVHVQDMKTFEKDENCNYGKLEDIPHYRDSGDKEEAQTLNKNNDESHITTTDLLITHGATGVGNDTQEVVTRNLDSNPGQSLEPLDNLQASAWETSNKKGVSSTLLSGKDAKEEVSRKETTECICEEENDNDVNIKDAAGSQQKDVPENVVLQDNQDNNASTGAIIEINETNFSIQDEVFEIQNDKRPEINIKGIIAEDKDPDSLPEKEKGHSLSTSELIEARETIITKDRLEEEDIAKKPFHRKGHVSEAGQTNAPNIDDEEDTSHSQNEKAKTENLRLENLSPRKSDMPVVHALLARALDISDQDGTSDTSCVQTNETKDTEEHLVSGDEKDSEYENTLKSDTKIHTLIHKKDSKGKCDPTEYGEPNNEVSILTDSDAIKEAKTRKEKIIGEIAEKHINEGSRNTLSEECGNSERDSFGSSVKNVTHDNKNPENAFKLDSSSSEMLAKTLKFENSIRENEKDKADGQDINNEKKKIEFEGNVKEEVNDKTAPEQNKLLDGYNAKATNDPKEEDEMLISNIEQNIKKTTEMKLDKAEESTNVDKSTQMSTEVSIFNVEELKTSGENSINVSDGSIGSNMMDTSEDQSAELPEEIGLRNEWENNDSKSENEDINNSLHRNNESDKPFDVKVIEKIKKQINAAQIQNPEMLETANFAKEQTSNEENFTMVDSREKEENKESKNEEKKNMSATILCSAMETVTVDGPKEHENTAKPSISETVNIVQPNKERIIESDEIAIEEPLDIGPSINNHDALHPSKEIDAAASAKEQEENNNCFALADTEVASKELKKSSSSVAPNESSILEDKVGPKLVQETENDAGNFITISNKENLDSMDPFDRRESKELKDKQEHVFAPNKDKNMILVVDQLEEIRNSDTSEMNMKEEINKIHDPTYNKSSKKERLEADISLDKKENREHDIKAEPVIQEPTKESHFLKVEESHFMQMKHDFDMVGISKMTKARESTKEETNNCPNTIAVTEAPLEKTFKPGETLEKITDSINSIKTIEEHIRNEIFHFNIPEKEDTQDTSFSIGKKGFIDEEVGSNLVPIQHNLDGLHPDKFEIEVLNEEANKCMNASSISKGHIGKNENCSNIIPIEHGNEVVDSKETIEYSESSVILASQQIITKGSSEVDKKAVSLEKETEHEVGQFNNSKDVNQQVPNDLPVSQFLLNQIMGGKLHCETDDFKSKTELNEETQDIIEQNKNGISREENDDTDNHIKPGTGKNTADDNVEVEDPTEKSKSVPVDKSQDDNKTIENGNEENTQRLGICGSFNKIGTDEEMISQFSEETNHEAFIAKTKQSLQMASASEIKEDVSPSEKIQVEETIQGEPPHGSKNFRKNLDGSSVVIEHDVGQKDENSDFVDMKEIQSDKELVKKNATEDIISVSKNFDALLLTMKGVVQKEEKSNFLDMEKKQPVKEIDDKTEVKDISPALDETLMVKKMDDSIRNQVISVKDSHPGTKVDMRDSNYPDTICFEKLDHKILGEKKTITEDFHDNDFVNKNIDVSLAKSTPIDESIPREDNGKFATSKEIHTNTEMVEEVQSLQASDGISATTKPAELKDTENQKNPEEAIQHVQFKVAEKLGYVVVEEQKPGKALKNGKEIEDMEKKPQVDIEEHAVNDKKIQSHLKESNLNTFQSEMQQETVKETIHISESTMEEKLQSEQQMEPMLKEEKHVIDEAGHETAKLLEIKEAKLSPQKKHGTIFSEVRSKFKHSISSVKKAITCSSSVNLN